VLRCISRQPHGDDRIVEADEQTRTLRQLQQLAGDDVGGLALDFAAALPANGPADAGPEEPQIVVDLGGRSHGGSRVAHAVLLTNGDRRRDAVDAVDVRLFHPFEELPRVGGERLHVPPLTLRINRVEGQR
jgi:hypothetical protein